MRLTRPANEFAKGRQHAKSSATMVDEECASGEAGRVVLGGTQHVAGDELVGPVLADRCVGHSRRSSSPPTRWSSDSQMRPDPSCPCGRCMTRMAVAVPVCPRWWAACEPRCGVRSAVLHRPVPRPCTRRTRPASSASRSPVRCSCRPCAASARHALARSASMRNPSQTGRCGRGDAA